MNESKSRPNELIVKEGWVLRGKLSFFFTPFAKLIFLHLLDLMCCDYSFTKSLIAAIINYKFSLPMVITSNLSYKQQLLVHLAASC